MLNIASQIGMSPERAHVAYVHFSSPNRTGVLVDLATVNVYNQFLARIEALDISQILGDTDVFR